MEINFVYCKTDLSFYFAAMIFCSAKLWYKSLKFREARYTIILNPNVGVIIVKLNAILEKIHSRQPFQA
jgi:hypothetical protein